MVNFLMVSSLPMFELIRHSRKHAACLMQLRVKYCLCQHQEDIHACCQTFLRTTIRGGGDRTRGGGGTVRPFTDFCGRGVDAARHQSTCQVPQHNTKVGLSVVQLPGKLPTCEQATQSYGWRQIYALHSLAIIIDHVVQHHPAQCRHGNDVPFPEEGLPGESTDVTTRLLRCLYT